MLLLFSFLARILTGIYWGFVVKFKERCYNTGEFAEVLVWY